MKIIVLRKLYRKYKYGKKKIPITVAYKYDVVVYLQIIKKIVNQLALKKLKFIIVQKKQSFSKVL